MSSSRDDFGIAIRSALLKEELDKIFFSISIIFSNNNISFRHLSGKVYKILKNIN